MPLQATSGAASYDAFGGGVAAVPNYIEDVFSTYLYTGNGSTQTITNGIDLSTKGGLVWIKSRSSVASHLLTDSGQGISKRLSSNSTAAAQSNFEFTSWNSNGFSLDAGQGFANTNAVTYASWTFRKQPKFFDVVTYTGSNSAKTVAHSLGSVPGCIIVKDTTAATNWYVYHRSTGNTGATSLNNTDAFGGGSGYWNNTDPTSTQFTVGTNLSVTGRTYVAYIFAHNAGGFGLTGTDNVISCGSYTGNGSATGPTVTLGYEPQWLLTKRTDLSADWQLVDTMRGMSSAYNRLFPNSSAVEDFESDGVTPTATGFKLTGVQPTHNASGGTYIYIAIRRGPMKVPTSGTSVFEPVTSTSANFIKGTLEASDMGWFKDRATVANWFVGDRLRGIMSYYNPTLYTNLTNAEATPTTGDTVTSTSSEGTGNGKIYFGGAGATTDQPLGYSFKRAPSFFDEVCYTGTGSATTVTHNLGAVPELMIVKRRNSAAGWNVYSAATGNTKAMYLNGTNAAFTFSGSWNNTSPTSTVFTLGNDAEVNASGSTYVAYLFATCAGVSKVGSYTGTGTTQQINCGFTAGSRFVLIKRTDSTGDWYVWDSARGIVAGNDPYLLLNSTAAEVTSTDYIDTYSAGFEISSTAPAAINASGGTFIFLAIA